MMALCVLRATCLYLLAMKLENHVDTAFKSQRTTFKTHALCASFINRCFKGTRLFISDARITADGAATDLQIICLRNARTRNMQPTSKLSEVKTYAVLVDTAKEGTPNTRQSSVLITLCIWHSRLIISGER